MGPDDGIELGAELGVELGDKLGEVVGPELGPLLGTELGPMLGFPVGPSLGTTDGLPVGPDDGPILALGAALGAGLLLGTELGFSVGHETVFPNGDGVLSESRQIPMWVMAVAPNIVTSTMATRGSSKTTFLYEPVPIAATLTVLVAPSTSVSWIQTSATTLSRPISTISSIGIRNSKEIFPPASFGFGEPPPVCWTITTLP